MSRRDSPLQNYTIIWVRPVPILYEYIYEGGTPQVNQEGALCPLPWDPRENKVLCCVVGAGDDQTRTMIKKAQILYDKKTVKRVIKKTNELELWTDCFSTNADRQTVIKVKTVFKLGLLCTLLKFWIISHLLYFI